MREQEGLRNYLLFSALETFHTSSTHSHVNPSLCEEEMRVERGWSSRFGGEEERPRAAVF
jgi:hypothetical protein